jgi:hypothetical protein
LLLMPRLLHKSKGSWDPDCVRGIRVRWAHCSYR